MRVRSISAIGIVLAGLIPAFLGGPVFAALMIALGIAAWREYVVIVTQVVAHPLPRWLSGIGAVAIGVIGLGAYRDIGAVGLIAVTFAAVVLTLAAIMSERERVPSMLSWAMMVSGVVYLGLPVFCAVALRQTALPLDSDWIDAVAELTPVTWPLAAYGLAWTLVIVLTTWIGDTAALLGGRRFGRRPLAPGISPNKTLEGAIVGLAGSSVVAALTYSATGLGAVWVGALAGVVLGAFGQFGDLTESFFKRQAGLKDSGAFIPGHGGVLDRIDALLFTFPLGYILSSLSLWWPT